MSGASSEWKPCCTQEGLPTSMGASSQRSSTKVVWSELATGQEHQNHGMMLVLAWQFLLGLWLMSPLAFCKVWQPHAETSLVLCNLMS